VAAVALQAIGAEVAIVLAVTADAVAPHLHPTWRLAMAIRADDLGVRAGQCETSLLRVIEFPDGPTVG